MPDKEKLFDSFPEITTRDWLDKINADLKGIDFDKKMIWKTREGFSVNPFYRREDLEQLKFADSIPGEFPYLRGTKRSGNPWFIRQNITVRDYREANKKAFELLLKGVTSIGFILDDPETVSLKNLGLLLDKLPLEKTEINFQCNGKALEILSYFREVVLAGGFELNAIRGALEVFPLGRLMLNGTLCIKVEEGLDYLSKLVAAASDLENFRVVQVGASDFSNAGADIATELAFGLSMGNEYLAALSERGISPAYAASKIRFSFGTGSNYFFEIAKLRAARLLWSAIVTRYDSTAIEQAKMNIHCVTSKWNKTVYDPYINLLRTQTEAMSSILGGTDSLTVEPFDSVFSESNDFSKRMARNQQLILKEEVHLDVVSDPSAGSYFIENITSLLSEQAWKIFIETEEKGGFLKALQSGYIQTRVKDIATTRMKDVAQRREVFVGTNQYPDSGWRTGDNIDEKIISAPNVVNSSTEIEPLMLSRATSGLEMLRIAVDRSGKRPFVFLLTTGDQVMRKARSQFSANFFGCGGYKIVESNEMASLEENIQKGFELNPDILVVCSSDEEYKTVVPVVAAKIKDGCELVVAGNPPCMEELKQAGIKHFISVRSDLLETLRMFNKLSGI